MATGSFRRRQLARELQQLRRERGLRSGDAALAADISQPTLSRIERGVVETKINTVKALLDVYQVVGERRDALLALARAAKAQDWWHSYGAVLPSWFEGYVSLEAEACTLCTYDGFLINGLFQTRDYARALLLASRPDESTAEIDRRVELRMQRQARLTGGELQLSAVVDECALHRVYGGPAVMSAQISRLHEIATLPNVSLHLLPMSGAPSTAGGFSILTFPEEHPPVVYLESELSSHYLERAEQVSHYSILFDRLRTAALTPEASIKRLDRLKE